MSSPLDDFFARHRRIGLDTSIFIYQIEENPKYVQLTDQVFQWLKSKNGRGVTSTITMLEVLVHPYRNSDTDLIDGYFALLSTYPHLTWVSTTLEIADDAARLRGMFNLKTPDAIQAATTLSAAATGFICNDPNFRKVPDFEVLLLDDLLNLK
jgi:predicted nucleic acid-binding protein